MASDPSPKGQQKAVRMGKYEVVMHIATGGMGAVYRVRDRETGRDYALKVLTSEMAAKPEMLERFRREAHHAAKLIHENIVRVYEFDQYKGTHFIVMEFVDGIDLLEHIERNAPLDPEETREIIIQATRALKHANDHRIVHRDVKPSNFLLTKKKGRFVVKLTDLGLARQATNDEFRVTRAGTTVGTVDYMSPEQARESGSADIRSDLYSLGCTWFHMLSGQPPFGTGGLAERILRHIEAEPPDVRTFNPRVSKALAKMLNKLLEKDPRDRYQTPAELLNELHSLIAVSDSEASLSSAKRVGPKRKGKGSRRDGETVAEKGKTVTTRSRRPLLWLGIVAASVLLFGAIGLVVALNWPRNDLADSTPPPNNPGDNPVLVTRPGLVLPPHPEIKPDLVVKPPPLPHLFEPNTPINIAELRERLDTVFPKSEPSNNPPLRFKRTAGGDPTVFSKLTDALAATPQERAVTIEIQDNGPLFWSMTAIGGREVTLRAAKGYRPLIVWDVQKRLERKPLAFFTVERGGLHLQGVDVVLQWPDNPKVPLTLVQATDADFSADHCTFSLSGRHPTPVAVTRFLATNKKTHRCRFTNCVLRGNSLTALDLEAPAGEVLFENCLIVGRDYPLFQVRSSGEPPPTLHLVRSTLTAATSLLQLQPTQMGDNSPSLNWLSWDSILSRSNEQVGGEMVVLPPTGDAKGIKWESVNTLYAGWQTLLAGAESVRQDATTTWERLMRWRAGDRAIGDIWPLPRSELAEIPATVFQTTKTPVAFAASVNADEPIGCVLGQLPPLRDNWKSLAYERFVIPSFDILEAASPPDIPADGTKFTGQVLDVSQDDLGLFLRKMQETRGFAPKVVMQLKGSGVQKMTPVKLKGVQLTLHFEQPADDTPHLSLTMPLFPSGTPLPAALLEIEDGGLDLINGEFVLPDQVTKAVTASLFKIAGGDLRLYRCRLYGPHLYPSPSNYRALIQFAGSGDVDGKNVRQCVVNESVLVSDKTALRLHGIGTRLLVKQSVLVAGGQALNVDLGAGFRGRANVQTILSNSTLAARQSVLLIDDVASPGPTAEPIEIQSMQCAFEAPFKDVNVLPGVARFGGEALAHGLFLWQSDADLFDRRFQYGCLPVEIDAPKPAPDWHATWLSLFGSNSVTRMKSDVALTRQFDVTKSWALEQLLLPVSLAPADKPPRWGADLIGKGFVKTPKRLP